MADTSSPKLIDLLIPSVIDVSKGAQKITFSARAEDEAGGSGIDRVVVYFDKNVVYSFGAGRSVEIGGLFSSGTDTFKDATPAFANGVRTFTEATSGGTYAVSQVWVYDLAGNVAKYTENQLKAMGVNTTFSVVGRAPDTTAPTLKSLSLPALIDVSKTSQQVSFVATAEDNAGGTGIERIVVYLNKDVVFSFGRGSTIEIGGLFSGGSDTFTDTTPSQGNGIRTFMTGTPAGSYAVSQVWVYDVAGNVAKYSQLELKGLGISTSFSVVDGKPVPLPTATVTTAIKHGELSLAFASADWQNSTNRISIVLNYEASAASFLGASLLGSGSSAFSVSLTEIGGIARLSITGSATNFGESGPFLGLKFMTLSAKTGFTYTVSSFSVNDRVQLLGRDQSAYLASGTDANDSIAAAVGGAHMDGGTGVDTVVYTRPKSDFVVSATSSGFTLTDASGNVQSLVSIERLRFLDTAIALDMDGTAGQAYRLYRAAFDRVPDAAGVGFWMNQLEKGMTLQDVAGEFARSAEFAAMYGQAPSSADIVTRLYWNILDRAPERAGFDFWVDVLDRKQATVAELLHSFSEGHENREAVAKIIAQGFEYIPFGGS